jgi:hypothetical protein
MYVKVNYLLICGTDPLVKDFAKLLVLFMHITNRHKYLQQKIRSLLSFCLTTFRFVQLLNGHHAMILHRQLFISIVDSHVTQSVGIQYIHLSVQLLYVSEKRILFSLTRPLPVICKGFSLSLSYRRPFASSLNISFQAAPSFFSRTLTESLYAPIELKKRNKALQGRQSSVAHNWIRKTGGKRDQEGAGQNLKQQQSVFCSS